LAAWIYVALDEGVDLLPCRGTRTPTQFPGDCAEESGGLGPGELVGGEARDEVGQHHILVPTGSLWLNIKELHRQLVYLSLDNRPATN
jgi:hypothetical protein